MTKYAYNVEDLGPYVVDPLEHIGLAKTISRRYHCAHLDAEDMFQEACAVLCATARNYDDSKGASYATWAGAIMGWHLRGAVAENARSGRFGTMPQHRAVMQRLRRELYRKPDADPREILTAGSVVWARDKTSDDDVRRAVDIANRSEIRLDQDIQHGDGNSPGSLTPLIELIPDEAHAEDIERAAIMAAWGRILDTVPLDVRERAIMDRRLLTDVPDTLQEIGDHFGLSRERIRQIEERLIERLRRAAVAAGLKAA